MRFTMLAVSAFALLTYAGCSEPVPQTPDGAFYVATVNNDPSMCKITGNTAQVGKVDQNEKNAVITDGTNGTKVDCSVINATAPFDVHAKVDDTANSGYYLEIIIPKISPSASKDKPATGTATIAAPWTAGSPYTGECNFYFEEGTKETVDAGRIWVSFDCPGITSGMSTCTLKAGFAIFENCLTESVTADD